MALGIADQLLRNHIKHGKAVFDYGAELLFQPLTNYIGKRVAVERLRTAVATVLQILLRAVYLRRESPFRERAYAILYLVRYLIRICYDYLACLFFSEIRKFREHLVCCSHIEPDIGIRIRKFHA